MWQSTAQFAEDLQAIVPIERTVQFHMGLLDDADEDFDYTRAVLLETLCSLGYTGYLDQWGRILTDRDYLDRREDDVWNDEDVS